jgi:putative restriction endonuclease
MRMTIPTTGSSVWTATGPTDRQLMASGSSGIACLKATPDASAVVTPPVVPPGQPMRVPTTIQRIVRSTAVAKKVKSAHDGRCQICGATIELPGGMRYSEAAHIRPLGLPHNGPDVESNILCLCPNDHVRFDEGAIYVDASGQVIDANSSQPIGALRTTAGHSVDADQLEHHRDRWILIT